ncbi:hypothetical protein [Seonamhaeicola aphaedonensis]|uniref:Uncharacterized protein n=1 Tax=Seonamhaeicola aphaedonensis TaxID=1461338 RepID=A0A3D9HG27_9FLAO|nr:hypothetical protein [Seonamhaeicola aphaedonensis]RED48385.1 hypothetical protein DFQ02_104231 [Seonamhaeicola aphaedonensis]
MAKQKGYIDLEGTLGGLTFYKSGGQSIVKTKSAINKDRILKESNFKRTRENMTEFGGSATVGKALRHGFATIIPIMSDRTVVGRLTAIMKRINANGTGVRGKREFDILTNKALLEGFEFNKSKPLESVFFAPFGTPTLDTNRSICTWLIPDFNTLDYIHAPEGATHFKLVLGCSVLSNYTYNNDLKQYTPTNPGENETSNIVFSNEIPLTGPVGSDTTLTTDLGFSSALPISVAVVITVGIIFYQDINGVLYELASDNAMTIQVVG